MSKRLGEFEQLLLFALLRLEDDAYGVTIRGEIERSAYVFDDREVDFSLTLAVLAYDGCISLEDGLRWLQEALETGRAQGCNRVVTAVRPVVVE